MNVPPNAIPPTPASDPTTPGAQPRPTALGAAVTGAVVGSPLAIATVWVLETYFTAHGKPVHFDEYTAAAVGAVGATVLGYISQVLKALLTHFQDKWTQP